MPVLAREGLLRRLVAAARRERLCVLLGGPGMGRTTVAQEALRRLRERDASFTLEEVPDDPDACARALGHASSAPRLLTGGLVMHRVLAESAPARPPDAPDARLVQRFPLVPLLRRDVEDWAARAGEKIDRQELHVAFAATGGHPALVHAWFEARRASPHADVVAKTVLQACHVLLERMQRTLDHPELAAPLQYLLEHRSASVARLRRETGAKKPSLDRLVIAGPVSRTLGERAEIALTCELYAQWRAARQNGSTRS